MLIVFGSFVVFLLIGMPVAFAIGISGALFFIQHPNLPFTIPIQLTISQTQNFALLAIPLFIVSGNLMNHAGITPRLLRLSTVLTGQLRGGLGQVSVAMATLMGSVSGSCIADAAMQTRILGPEMVKRGFTKGYAASVLSWGSLMTPIIPPGIGYILYGTVGQVSIGRLFAGGIIPGLMLWAGMALTVGITAYRRGIPAERKGFPPASEVISATVGGIWAILFPAMLIFGLRFGIFTPSEIGAFAVVYSFVIGVLAYRELTGATLKEALMGSTVDVGAVMFLIAMSGIFAYGIVYEQVPDAISEWVLGLTKDPYSVMMLMVGVLARRRLLRRRFGADHHADADLPADRRRTWLRSGAFRPGVHHHHHHRQLHPAGGLGDVCGVLDLGLPDRRLHQGIGAVPDHDCRDRRAPNLLPRARALHPEHDLRRKLAKRLRPHSFSLRSGRVLDSAGPAV